MHAGILDWVMWARQVTDGTFAPMRFARAGGSSPPSSETATAAHMYEIAPEVQAYGTVAWVDWFGTNSEFGK